MESRVLTSRWFPSVCLSVRTVRFLTFFCEVWHQRPFFYNFCPPARPFICSSVCPYPFSISFLPSDFSNSVFVWKVWHQRPNFYNFCLSVRSFIRRPVPYSTFNFRSIPFFNFRSNRQISEIVFVRLSVPPSTFRSNNQIFKKKKKNPGK